MFVLQILLVFFLVWPLGRSPKFQGSASPAPPSSRIAQPPPWWTRQQRAWAPPMRPGPSGTAPGWQVDHGIMGSSRQSDSQRVRGWGHEPYLRKNLTELVAGLVMNRVSAHGWWTNHEFLCVYLVCLRWSLGRALSNNGLLTFTDFYILTLRILEWCSKP